MPRPETKGTTGFARWRRQLGISKEEAAELLGIKVNVVRRYEIGQRPGGAPCHPALPMRLLMALLAEGHRPKAPWPK